eukprot:8374214-Pyramimonas_sp.AAC.1
MGVQPCAWRRGRGQRRKRRTDSRALSPMARVVPSCRLWTRCQTACHSFAVSRCKSAWPGRTSSSAKVLHAMWAQRVIGVD